MNSQPVVGANLSPRWSYERWSAADPDSTVTAQVTASDALAGTAPSLAHRVDTWAPGTVQADWNQWSLRSTWAKAAADLASAPPPPALPVAQRFIVSPAAATLASTPASKLGPAVAKAVAPLLRMTPSQVTARLVAGASLADLGVERKVGHGDLVNAVRTAVPNVHDATLQTFAAQQLVDAPGPVDLGAVALPATAGGDQTQVLALSLDGTAAMLGTTPAELAQTLSGGRSLLDVAAEAGVDRDTLLSAVADDLPPQVPGWTGRATLAALIAADTTSTTERPAPPPPPPPPEQRFTLESPSGEGTFGLRLKTTAAVLGATADGVMRALSGGRSLGDLADAAGVSYDDLTSAIMADLPEQTPGWSDSLELADAIASDTTSVTYPPPTTPDPVTGPRQQFSLDNGFELTTTAMSLDATAELLSSTPDAVMRRLSRGLSLNDLADAAGVTHQDLLDAVMADLPADTAGWTDASALAEQITSDVSSATVPPPADSGVRQLYAVNDGGTARVAALSLDVTAALLRAGLAELNGLLSQGYSLADLAQVAGVSHDDLLASVLTDLPIDLSDWSDPIALAESVIAGTSSVTASVSPNASPYSQS